MDAITHTPVQSMKGGTRTHSVCVIKLDPRCSQQTPAGPTGFSSTRFTTRYVDYKHFGTDQTSVGRIETFAEQNQHLSVSSQLRSSEETDVIMT